MHPIRRVVILVAVALLSARGATATPVDNKFSESKWAFVASDITSMAWAPDGSGRLFLTRKQGEVYIVRWGLPNGTLVNAPFVTVNPLYARNGSECGLLGIAFDHNFVNNRYVYLFADVADNRMEVIRYTANGDLGVDKKTILGAVSGGANHVGGGLSVGPDNKLYWSIGDLGGGFGANMDLASMAAKVGRANLDGTAPNDNPFYDGMGPNNDFVFARGLRNPFKINFQRSTGLLWVNSVGTSYEQVFVMKRGDHGGWNMYEANQPAMAPFIKPVIKYRTGGGDTFSIEGNGGLVRSNNVLTVTTTGPHLMRPGEKVTIDRVPNNNAFNGDFYVASTSNDPATRVLTVVQQGPDATHGGGRLTPMPWGRSITGGTFYDSSGLSAAYHGDYFFGDYVSNQVMRATLDPNKNEATSVDLWATAVTTPIDVAVGPDGALYYTGYNGQLYRTDLSGAPQGITVAPMHVTMLEGGAAVLTVRLAAAPNANVTVGAARTAGDADIEVGQGAMLTFTPQNYATPQIVRLAAKADMDGADDVATISLTSQGLSTRAVIVRAIDDNTASLVVSTAALEIMEGGRGTFTVMLSSAPQANVAVGVARTAGDMDVSVAIGAMLTFTPMNWNQPQMVTIAAAEDMDVTDDTATITASAMGFSSRAVEILARDNEASPPKITTMAKLTGVIDAPYSYDVDATGLPAPMYALDAMPQGMTINAMTGVISWTPPMAGMFPVTVAARNGTQPDDTQKFTIAVAADMAPTCALTLPAQDQVLAGAGNEFFGDCFDDVGCVRAEFSIDGMVAYTDVNTMGHYHYGSSHGLWDTTKIPDGPHMARMTVFDTKGKSCFVEVRIRISNSSPPDLSGITPPDLTHTHPADLAPVPDLAVAPGSDAAAGGDDLALPQDAAADVPDSANPPVAISGCSCRTGARASNDRAGALLSVAVALGLLVRPRGRRRRRA